jgi:hypothetical protein
MPASRAMAIRSGTQRDRIGGLRSRHEPGKGIDLIIHHQQRGAPGINVRKLRHAFLLADVMSFLTTCSPSISKLGLLQGVSQRFGRGLNLDSPVPTLATVEKRVRYRIGLLSCSILPVF